jgi:uncharacterized membrane protein YphA (DoxX/SURF4 family)/thiol-disulfide isomerase/thioredoxin
MDTVVLALRIVLVVVFATAGYGKLRDLDGSRRAMKDFGVPEGLAPLVGAALPIVELIVAVLLIFPATARAGAIAAALLLLAFMAGIARALSKGEQPDCHCFGQIHSAPAGRGTLIRNGVLAAAAIVIAAYGSGPSISSWVSDRSAAELVAVGLGIVALVLAAYAWSLRERVASLSNDLRISRKAGALGGRFGLPVGTEAPRFEVKALDGEPVTLMKLLEPRKPLLLLFMSPWCGPCAGMLPKVQQWQQTLSERMTIAVLSTGTPVQNEMLVEQGIENVLLQEEMEVADIFSVKGTPTAVVINKDGNVASNLGEMEQAIEPLVRLALRHGSNVISVEGTAA